MNNYDRRAAIVNGWVTDITCAGSPANPHTESAWPTRYLSNALVASPPIRLNTVGYTQRGTKPLYPPDQPAQPNRKKRRRLQPIHCNIMRPGKEPCEEKGEGSKQPDVRRSSRIALQHHSFTASNCQHATQAPSTMPERGGLQTQGPSTMSLSSLNNCRFA